MILCALQYHIYNLSQNTELPFLFVSTLCISFYLSSLQVTSEALPHPRKKWQWSSLIGSGDVHTLLFTTGRVHFGNMEGQVAGQEWQLIYSFFPLPLLQISNTKHTSLQTSHGCISHDVAENYFPLYSQTLWTETVLPRVSMTMKHQ